jgi:hypothetical protein
MTNLLHRNRGIAGWIQHVVSSLSRKMRKSTPVRHLHCDVAKWLVQLTWGAPTEKIHRVLLVVIHWNSFDCPRLFRAFCASTRCVLYASTLCNLVRSTIAFPSGRANDGIQRYFGKCSSFGYLRYRYGQSPFNLYLHLFFLFFKSLLHHLASMLLFALFSSFAAFIAIKVSLEGILSRHHPVAPAMSLVF